MSDRGPKPAPEGARTSRADEVQARRGGGPGLLSRLPGMAYQCRNDLERTMDLASEGTHPLTGYDPDELVGPQGLTYADIVHPADRDPAWHEIQDSISSGDSAFEVGYRIVRKDGEVRSVWERGHAVYSPNGEILGLEGFITDVTELEHARQTLSDSEKIVRSLVEQGLVGVFIIKDGIYSYVNEAFAEIFGFQREEIENRLGPLDLTAEEDRETVRDHVPGLREGGENTVRYEVSGRRKDGRSLRIEVHGSRIEQGGRAAIAGVVVDVTEQRTLQEQLRHAQRVEGLGELSGAIAHDFNNYLTAIIAPIELAIQDLEEGDPAREELLLARATAERAAGLTRQLLSFGRKRVHSPRPVSLTQVVENLAAMLERITGARIEVVYELAPDLPAVLADPSDLQQVIMNLVVNARDAMPEGGRLVIRTGEKAPDSIDAVALPDRDDGAPGSYVSLAVHDEGQGMEETTLEHIFDPYFTTKETGTGLGLSTVFGIVKQHGGEVRARSALGRGTDVTIFLPATSRAVVSREEGGSENVSGGGEEERGVLRKSTILVVEDEDAVRRVTTAALRRFGYTVFDAADGEEALALLDAHIDALDLVIIDMGLPKMTGPDVARAVEERRPELPVLFMSGHASEEFVGELDDREGVRFLEKPFMVDELLDAVDRALDGPGPRATARDAG